MQLPKWSGWRGTVSVVLLAGSLSGCGDDGEDDGPKDGAIAEAGPRDGAAPAPAITVSPELAISGACLVKLGVNGEAFEECTGFERLETCARQQCDLDLCIEQCPQYYRCLQASAVPCDDACVPENACAHCMSQIAQCVFMGSCIGSLHCAELVEGGYCDQLRSCCEEVPEMRQLCGALAEATSSLQGEATCRQLLGTVPSLFDGSVSCPIRDAGPPQR